MVIENNNPRLVVFGSNRNHEHGEVYQKGCHWSLVSGKCQESHVLVINIMIAVKWIIYFE